MISVGKYSKCILAGVYALGVKVKLDVKRLLCCLRGWDRNAIRQYSRRAAVESDIQIIQTPALGL